MKTVKTIKTLLIALVITIIFSSCPPVNEDPFTNVIAVPEVLNFNSWLRILQQIENDGYPVVLDLRACPQPENFTHDDYDGVLKIVYIDGTRVPDPSLPDDPDWPYYIAFDPLPGISMGKQYIEALFLPDYVTMINYAADVTLPHDADNSVINAGIVNSAFRFFLNLRFISGEKVYTIGNFAFFGLPNLETVNFPMAVQVMQYAFYGCNSLKSIYFEFAQDISIRAFQNCASLSSINLPNVSRIAYESFRGCISLGHINLPKISEIPPGAFRDCASLTEAVFTSATKIADEAFRNCINLRTARFWADPTRNSSGHPLDPWMSDTPDPYPVVEDSMIFFANVFRGCRFLSILDIRNAWNVYFADGALADIGEHLNIYLFDSTDTATPKRSYGHPQVEQFLGDRDYLMGSAALPNNQIGRVSLRSLSIYVPVVESDTQIWYDSPTPGEPGLLRFIHNDYNTGIERDDDNIPINPRVAVTVQRRPD